jgi:uncharacterized Fe-S cluster-containing radical SAM superfamily protein
MTENNEPKSHKNQNHQSPPMPRLPAFDPIALNAATERAVCQGNKRKYYRFVNTINYRGIAEGYPVGCNLRCIFCWASETRDQSTAELSYYSPQDVFDRISAIAKKKGLQLLGISHAEATLGKSHLLELLELVERSDFKRFVLETNGILLGHDRSYARDLAAFKKVWVRVSIKAGTPEAFTRKTGASAEAFEYPFQALRYLKDAAVDFSVAAMSADPRFMDPLERISLIGRLAAIDPHLVLNLEEEMVVFFANTSKRLKAAGWTGPRDQLHFLQKVPFLKNIIQMPYYRISYLAQKKLDRGFTWKAIKELFLYYKI